jgi:hypothetical protein
VDEVAAFALTTVSFFDEEVATYHFKAPIALHIYSQLFRAMSKLTLLIIRVATLLCKFATE